MGSARTVAVSMTRRQKAFMDADATEVLFGGAAGGGKSYGQLIDAMRFAMQYPKSKQLIMRRTFPELEKSLIRGALELYPREAYRYNQSSHTVTWANGSLVDFGYCNNENDVHIYQSAEYDVIRFDELTHFSEYMYTYLFSRLRGANDFPKQIKSSTNPGNVGHVWVKERFIDPAPPEVVLETAMGTRVFLPSFLDDNKFLVQADPDYRKRLEALPERERKALLLGDWNIFEGQFFAEFSSEVHVCEPFAIPAHWRRYRALDYGLDMLACLWIAVDEQKRAYVYRELYEPDLIISEAAARILAANEGDSITMTLGPPDMWARRQETGRSAFDIFAENGVLLAKGGGDRVDGWLAAKEWLAPHVGEQGEMTADLKLFSCCRNLIRTVPALQVSDKNPNDVMNEPHELTHAPDALRLFCTSWTTAAEVPPAPRDADEPGSYEEQVNVFLDFNG